MLNSFKKLEGKFQKINFDRTGSKCISDYPPSCSKTQSKDIN